MSSEAKRLALDLNVILPCHHGHELLTEVCSQAGIKQHRLVLTYTAEPQFCR